MKIAVIGGTGLIGPRLVDTPTSGNLEIASPTRGVGTVTGKGLAEALSAPQERRFLDT